MERHTHKKLADKINNKLINDMYKKGEDTNEFVEDKIRKENANFVFSTNAM